MPNGNARTIEAEIVRLIHPNGSTHVELTGNEMAPVNSGGGLVNVMDGGGTTTVVLDGNARTIQAEIVRLIHPNGNAHVELTANETAPVNSGGGLVNVMDGGGTTTVMLDGNAGTITARDVVLAQADCAEDFDLATGAAAEPGSVMVLDGDGALTESYGPYDRKVAGVVSGAGDYRPGITLGRKTSLSVGRIPLALTGKVFCKVDADYGPIHVGDLLVTSSTPAHAMKANDADQAFGAVVGKALRALVSGRGLIPILVSLQ